MLNPCDPTFVAHLTSLLPADTLRPVEPRYLVEPRSRWQGQGGAVALPRTAGEVSVLLRACSAAGVGVVPWGGGTGLVGGQLAEDGPMPLILSLERMAAIRDIFPDENVIIVESGAILADVQAAAERVDRLFPLTLASQGSCRIGGNLSTNAGGINVLRYGSARDLCLGIEAVLPDGSVFNGLKRLRKDNTGYDLRGLLIGAEGTLGIITAASLKLAARPASCGTALLVVRGPTAALRLLALAGQRLGGMVEAFELVHRVGLEFLAETMPELRQPFAIKPDWMVMIDIGLVPGLDAQAEMAALYQAAEAEGLVSDGVIAQSAAQRAAFWTLREALPEGNKRIGAISSHDISLPLGEIGTFIDRAAPALARIGDFRINCFGHLGDGNLHYNVFPPKGRKSAEYKALAGDIKACVHGLTNELGGSFSAEHGVGRLKVQDLQRYGDPAKLHAMRAIKAALDPRGIMNPGAVLARD